MTPRHLYIHVPFCSRRCSYCDFSIAVRKAAPTSEFLRGLERELATVHSATTLETVYAGGGTPSKLGTEGIATMLDLVRSQFGVSQDAEITIEANPEDVSPESAKAWKKAGVNRISLGLQSFDDAVLQWMHRVHDSTQSLRAVNDLRSAGFENISIDLIFGIPTSLNRSWQKDLDTALEQKPDHVSLYGLTIEDHTPLARWESRGEFVRTTDDTYASEFLAAHNAMTAAGFDHYEVSNFGIADRHSRHNSAYWSRASYQGIGPSAHSFDGTQRWWNARDYVDWLEKVNSGASPVAERENLAPDQLDAERIYLGLRTSGGLKPTEREQEAASRWVDQGWASFDDESVKLTAEGWLRLDSLASQLTVL